MPGRLRASYRSGNLSEHLGLLLLKGVAAIAEVPRTEDVGLDAVATLLRRAADGNCYAEDSFVVQLKSESAPTIEYRDHELKWLLGQSQPMFVGRVSLADSRIRLYPTVYINQAVFALETEHVSLRFGPRPLPPNMSAENSPGWAKEASKTATVWLGNPLLEWRIADIPTPEWQELAYKVLKRFLAMAQRELGLLVLGRASGLTWSTNDPESIRSGWFMAKGHPDNLQALATQSVPVLNALLLHTMVMPADHGDALAIPLLAIFARLRELGISTSDAEVTELLVASRWMKRGPTSEQSATAPEK
jgi:hypothetical protein